MATYSFEGYLIQRTNDFSVWSLIGVPQISFVYSDNVPHLISYSIVDPRSGGLASVTLTDRPEDIRFGTGSLNQNDPFAQSGDSTTFGTVVWGTPSAPFETDVFVLFDTETRLSFVVPVGGDALPEIEDSADFNSWNATVLFAQPSTSPFGPGDAIFLENSPFVEVTQADLFTGTDEADRFLAGAAQDTVSGEGGNDLLYGGADRDQVFGGNGNDAMFGNSEADTLDGGAGNDRMFGGRHSDLLYGRLGADTMHGEGGSDQMFGGVGADYMTGGWFDDRLFGGADDDRLEGDEGADRLFGGMGRDILLGGGGNDTLFGAGQDDYLGGGIGDDKLFGEGGRDILSGEFGNDELTGGFFSDRFVFRDGFGLDTITDFDPNNINEKIDLRQVSAIEDLEDLYTNHLFQVGADVEIRDLLGNVVTVQNVLLADLQNGDDFLI